MKKNKAFTLVEILAVIIILGLISGIALVSVSRYRAKALEDEKKSIRGSINDAFNNYRVYHNVSKEESIALKDLRFDKNVKFNGKTCDLEKSKVYYIVRGTKVKAYKRTTDKTYQQNKNYYSYNGKEYVLLQEYTPEDRIEGYVYEEMENGSKAEDICVYLVCGNDETIIDDSSLCSPDYTVTENSGE